MGVSMGAGRGCSRSVSWFTVCRTFVDGCLYMDQLIYDMAFITVLNSCVAAILILGSFSPLIFIRIIL